MCDVRWGPMCFGLDRTAAGCGTGRDVIFWFGTVLHSTYSRKHRTANIAAAPAVTYVTRELITPSAQNSGKYVCMTR